VATVYSLPIYTGLLSTLAEGCHACDAWPRASYSDLRYVLGVHSVEFSVARVAPPVAEHLIFSSSCYSICLLVIALSGRAYVPTIWGLLDGLLWRDCCLPARAGPPSLEEAYHACEALRRSRELWSGCRGPVNNLWRTVAHTPGLPNLKLLCWRSTMTTRWFAALLCGELLYNFQLSLRCLRCFRGSPPANFRQKFPEIILANSR
jgi:hypothetical protein